MGYAAVSLGLFIFLFAFFTLNAPQKPTQKQPSASLTNSTGFCQSVDPVSATTFKAPADYAKSRNAPAGSIKVEGFTCSYLKNPSGNPEDKDKEERHLFSPNLVTYRLVRKNVPLSTTNIKKGEKDENFNGGSCHFDTVEEIVDKIPSFHIEGVDETKYKVFFPETAGEISLSKDNLLRFYEYGLVFLLHKNDDGTFTEHKGTYVNNEKDAPEEEFGSFYLADIYQDIESGRPELPPAAFACDLTGGGASNTSNQKVVIPDQNPNLPIDQLQLRTFVINEASSAAAPGEVVNGWGIHCKPAVYLYPPKKQLVNVKVYPSGFLTYVDPPYDNDSGWTVWAEPDGKLQPINDLPALPAGRRFTIYNYLYFESKIRDEVIKKPTTGWVIKSEESKVWFAPLEDHFNNILPKLGLNEQQTKDFIEYWKKALPFSPYYFVGIIDPENVDQIERLEITPKPDSINRVRVYFERLDAPITVQAPEIKTINDERLTINDFRVVEWGGMVKNDPNHPFTCSQ